MAKQDLPIDKGWAWVIALVTCGTFGTVAGSFKSQGIILVELQERFPETSAVTLLWVFGLSSVILDASGVCVSWFILRTSYRTCIVTGLLMMVVGVIGTAYSPYVWTMYISYGFCYGIGTGMVLLASLLATTQYFDKRKALAVGISASGSGVFTLIIPNLLRVLFDYYDFSGALLLYGGFLLQLVILSFLLRPFSFYERQNSRGSSITDSGGKPLEPKKMEEKKHFSRQRSSSLSVTNYGKDHTIFGSAPGLSHLPVCGGSHYLSYGDVSSAVAVPSTNEEKAPDKSFNWSLVLHPMMWMFGVSLIFYGCGAGMVYQSIAPLAESRGVEKGTVAIVLAVAGVAEVPFRIANGWLADKKIMTALGQYCLCVTVAGTAALLCAMISGLPGIIIMLTGMSCVGTSVYSLLTIICMELVGPENITSAMGLQSVPQALAFAITTPVAGWIYDTYGWWEPVFFYISGVMYMGAAITTPFCIYKYCKQKESDQPPQF